MSTNEKDIPIANHEYDGIQEYNNPLPLWWLTTFYGTMVFAACYWVYYTFLGGPTQLAYLKQDMTEVQTLQAQHHSAPESEEVFAKLAQSADALSKGGTVFSEKCAVCHGAELQGNIGPNLTDDYWINGKGSGPDIAAVIRKGVLDKGMPTWEGMLKDDQIQEVTAYILSKRGSNPPNPKAPQGEKVVTN